MKKRIALTVNTLSGGGAERAVSNLSRALSDRYDVDIVVNDKAHIDYPYKGRILSLHMPARGDRMGAVYQICALARRIRALGRMKRSGKYAAVISFSEMTNLANVLSGNKDARSIASVHIAAGRSRESGLKYRLFHAWLLPLTCRRADCTVSCSREIEDELIESYGLSRENSAVICNGLDIPHIRKKMSEKFSDPDERRFHDRKILVSVGRMTQQKGQWHLLRAVKKLREDGIPVLLLLLGDGELRQALQEEVDRLGLSDCVDMPGFVENPYKYMARADALVMPSLYEGFSSVLIEAMACGAPVISTDHETGAREILAPDTDYRKKVTDRIEECAYGLLVPVCEGGPDEDRMSGNGMSESLMNEDRKEISEEEALMAEAIRRILTDDTLAERYRRASRVRAGQLSMDAICRQWIDVIEGSKA